MTFFSTDTGSRLRNNCSRPCRDQRDESIAGAGPGRGPQVAPARPRALSLEDQRRGADDLQNARRKFGADSPEYKAKLEEIVGLNHG